MTQEPEAPMPSRRLRTTIQEMSEEELRLQVVIPLLRSTDDVRAVTDVHGQNERGLDIVFMTQTAVESICYGLQLKVGTIGGGGTNEKTVKQILDQLQLANDFAHPITTQSGEFKIDRFIVATSGNITNAAREEITRRLKAVPVRFWDGNELIRRIHSNLPELFQVSDGTAVAYLRALRARYDVLDSLDQVPGVAKRTLSQVFIEADLRRKYDPTVSANAMSSSIPSRGLPCLSLLGAGHNAVIVADQDAGKTSILRMIALRQVSCLLSTGQEEARPTTGLPVLVRAKDILASGFSVVDGIKAEFRRMHAEELIDTLEADLAGGNYFLLTDGFSEFTREEDKDLLSRLIEEFGKQFPEVQIIVAARPVDFLTPRYLQTFYQYGIQDFSDSQVRDLATRWTRDSKTFADVTQKMIERLREALQLPGSPIPATIGVMLHEEQGRFITNTAEAIDRYMVIRLGRYAHELGMKQEVEWTKKQDLLAEVAYGMVDDGVDTLSADEFVSRLNSICARLGEDERGTLIFGELVASGVLVQDGKRFAFHRTSFKDFFAGHYLFRSEILDEFAKEKLFDRKWGGAIVFGAGLRRNNSTLLNILAGSVERYLAQAVGDLSEDHYYAAYLCGRVLSNSDAADHKPRMAALRSVLQASARSIPGFEEVVVEHYGAIGRLLALIGTEQSFFITVGVPWLRKQLQALLADARLTDEERYIIASTYTHLGFDDCYSVLSKAIKEAKSLRVIVALHILVQQLDGQRKISDAEEVALSEIRLQVARKLAGRGEDVKKLIEVKSKILEMERGRVQRIMASKEKRT